MKKKEKSKNPNKIKGVQVEHCLVLKALGGDKFKVQLPNEHIMTCYLGGNIRKNIIRILPYDYVTLELSPYDVMNNGRIIYREK